LKIFRVNIEELCQMEETPSVLANRFCVQVMSMSVGVLQLLGLGTCDEIGKFWVNAPCALTNYFGQLNLVKHSYGQVFQRINWVTALFRIIRIL
tara:strand:+ start:401 stop:682 length:282 start_codon:yes stop_codon:yes gene_type:complete